MNTPPEHNLGTPQPEEKGKAGRPSEYSQEKAKEICERIAEGESLNKICKSDGMPNKTTAIRWMATYPDFATSIAYARKLQADHYVDEQIDIADGATPENWQVKKFQADTRKWVASKLAPKKYGDRTTLAGDPDNPLEFRLSDRLKDAVEKNKTRNEGQDA